MVHEDRAIDIANEYIRFPQYKITKFIDMVKVWYCSYSSKEYVNNRTFTISDYGNQPFIIDKDDGEIFIVLNPLILHFDNKLWNPEIHGARCSKQHKDMFIQESIDKYLQEKYK